jgi:excisionase family DNA binding protein
MEDLFTMTETAAILGVTRETLRRWSAAGRLEILRLGPKTWRVSRTELKRMLSVPI